MSALETQSTGVGMDDNRSAHEANHEPKLSAEDLARLVLDQLEDDKAENILAIDLDGKSSLADTMVIASGRSQRHVSALADHLSRAMKDAGVGRANVEGLPNCDWVLIDAGDVIVHIFRPEVREFYNLERIWGADAETASDTPS